MKHLTCDLCGNPAPILRDFQASFTLVRSACGHPINSLELCQKCDVELYRVIAAKCAELRKVPGAK